MPRRLAVNVLASTPPGSGQASQVFGPDDTDIPEWAAEQIGDHAWEGGESDGKGYDDLKVDELKAEIDGRNEGRGEEDQIVPDGAKKADLVAALAADDTK